MKTSCINHKPGTMIAILRQDYLDICDNHVGAAFLLSFFEYWHNIKLEMSVKNRQANDIAEKHGDPPTQDTSLYQFHNAEQIYSSMMGAVGRPAIKDGIDALVKKGFITVHKNPNPRYAFDSTKHFLLHPHKINETIGLQKLSKPIRENCQTGLQKPLSGGLNE